jgi:hypothetical protein
MQNSLWSLVTIDTKGFHDTQRKQFLKNNIISPGRPTKVAEIKKLNMFTLGALLNKEKRKSA